MNIIADYRSNSRRKTLLSLTLPTLLEHSLNGFYVIEGCLRKERDSKTREKQNKTIQNETKFN